MDNFQRKFELSVHAQVVIEARGIKLSWIDQVLNDPEKFEKDAEDNELKHYLGSISEFGGRVLRVVVNYKRNPVRVVTAYFDRTQKGKL